MGLKNCQIFQRIFPSFSKRTDALDEFSSLIPKVVNETSKADYRQDYGGIQCNKHNSDEENNSCLECNQIPTKEWNLLKMHESDILLLFIKNFMFFSNFVFSLLGFALLGFGFWGLIDKQSLIGDRIGNISTDPMACFVLVGLISNALSLSGCLGFIRENICLLKFYSIVIIILMVTQILTAIIFFSFSGDIINSVKNSMLVAMSRYEDDSDLKFIMDEIQLGMECCGVESYSDWTISLYFNCTSPGVYACGVPYSCCLDPFENGTVINSQCGVGAMQMGESLAGSLIYLGGCVPQITLWLNHNFWDITSSLLLVLTFELICVLCAQRMLDAIAFVKAQW